MATIRHPDQERSWDNPWYFDCIVDTFVDVSVPYWMDLIDPIGRVRLTNTNNGHYVILDDRKEGSDIYPDECLFKVIRGDVLRLRELDNSILHYPTKQKPDFS